MTTKAGRPKLEKDKRRHVLISARLLPEEADEITAAISKTSEKKSIWIRKALLSRARDDKSNT